MTSVALPAWARPQHPIVHYELGYWLRSRAGKRLRDALWGGSLLLTVFRLERLSE